MTCFAKRTRRKVSSMSSMQFQCPQCKAIFSSQAVVDGMTVACPKCSARFEVLLSGKISRSVDEKPLIEKWLLQKARVFSIWFWKGLRSFVRFEKLETTDISRFTNAASTFEFSRLFPLAVVCLGFGWYLSWIYDDQNLDFRYDYESRWAILPMAALALYGAFRGIRHFLRPKTTQWGAWITTCLFTSVAGIILLFAFMRISDWAVEAWAEGKFRPRNILMFAVVLIGLCYKFVNDPYSSLFAKFIGFIGGVGFCEEATKLLPICLLVLNRRKLPFKIDLSLHSFLMLGFFSGLGFGIGEALVSYAIPENDDFVSQLGRWFACVPSHAVYTVIDAAFLWMFHRRIAEAEKMRGKVGWFALCVATVAFLHGIYDTLCCLQIANPILEAASLAILDAASLVLMWRVVRYAANLHVTIEGNGDTSLEDFDVTTCRTFGKSFAKTYIVVLAGVVIYAKIFCH